MSHSYGERERQERSVASKETTLGRTETNAQQHMGPHSVQPPPQQSSSTGSSFVCGEADEKHSGSSSQHASGAGSAIETVAAPGSCEMPIRKVATKRMSQMGLKTAAIVFLDTDS